MNDDGKWKGDRRILERLASPACMWSTAAFSILFLCLFIPAVIFCFWGIFHEREQLEVKVGLVRLLIMMIGFSTSVPGLAICVIARHLLGSVRNLEQKLAETSAQLGKQQPMAT